MAAPKKPTHVVDHKKLYLAVAGKLQHIPQGTEIVLAEAAAERLGKKVRKIGEKNAIDLTKADEGSGDAEK